jgi:hypothetical protein
MFKLIVRTTFIGLLLSVTIATAKAAEPIDLDSVEITTDLVHKAAAKRAEATPHFVRERWLQIDQTTRTTTARPLEGERMAFETTTKVVATSLVQIQEMNRGQLLAREVIEILKPVIDKVIAEDNKAAAPKIATVNDEL